MDLKERQKLLESELQKLESDLSMWQKILQDREKRLRYFMEEGISDNIVRKALTSVEEAQSKILQLESRRMQIRTSWALLGGGKVQ